MRDDDDGPVTRRSDADWGRSASKIRVAEALAGKYRIDAIIGSGGMGTVLRAHHIQLDQPVAIKVMHSELLTIEDAPRRFQVEARATAALKSKHVVRIIDIDRLPSGAPFIVMELLQGHDLATIVAERGPLTVDRAVHYLLQAADAMSEAHSKGIIHRDLKPQNLFLADDGVVKVLDFGLAKALRRPDVVPSSSQTSADMVVGSPHYMAPEQLWRGQVTERTDIWGFGATLYHLLTGAPPFPAPNIDVLASHIGSQDPPRISARRDDVSATVDDVIARCMRKNPDDRFRSVAAFQGALLHLRVELQTRRVDTTAAVASTTPGSNEPGGSLGSTVPITTRRDGSRLSPDNAATLAPATEPDLPSVEHPADEPRVWEGDDEPTQISGGTPPPSRRG